VSPFILSSRCHRNVRKASGNVTGIVPGNRDNRLIRVSSFSFEGNKRRRK
jgi:hypothetical protein